MKDGAQNQQLSIALLFTQPVSEHTQQTAVRPASHLSRFINQNLLHHCPVCLVV